MANGLLTLDLGSATAVFLGIHCCRCTASYNWHRLPNPFLPHCQSSVIVNSPIRRLPFVFPGKPTSINSFGLKPFMPAQSTYLQLINSFRSLIHHSKILPEYKHSVVHHLVTEGTPVLSRPHRLPQDKLKAAKARIRPICCSSVLFVHLTALGPPHFI